MELLTCAFRLTLRLFTNHVTHYRRSLRIGPGNSSQALFISPTRQHAVPPRTLMNHLKSTCVFMAMKIDIGCGRYRKDGFIGIDMQKTTCVDILSNVDYGLPFADDSIEEVYSSHTIEHLTNCDLFLRELARVCKSGALIELRMPYYSYIFALNPGHKYPFSDEWFQAVVRDYYSNLFSIEKVEYKECPGVRDELGKYEIDFSFAKKHFNNVIEDFTVYLRVVKGPIREDKSA